MKTGTQPDQRVGSPSQRGLLQSQLRSCRLRKLHGLILARVGKRQTIMAVYARSSHPSGDPISGLLRASSATDQGPMSPQGRIGTPRVPRPSECLAEGSARHRTTRQDCDAPQSRRRGCSFRPFKPPPPFVNPRYTPAMRAALPKSARVHRSAMSSKGRSARAGDT